MRICQSGAYKKECSEDKLAPIFDEIHVLEQRSRGLDVLTGNTSREHAAGSHPPLLAFIVGHSRAGTTWMSRCLTNHPDVAVFGETKYWGRMYLRPNNRGYYSPKQITLILDRLKKKGITGHGLGRLRNITSDNLSQIIDAAFGSSIEYKLTPRSLFLRICELIADKEDKTWIIEKTPHHLNYINRIKKVFPTGKFIIMIREPYGFMLSYKHRSERHADKDTANKRKKKMMYHPLGCAIVWRKYFNSAINALNMYSKCCLLVSLEEVKQDPRLVMNKVLGFLGIPYVEDMIEPPINTSFPSGTRPMLRSDDIFWMNLIARREIRAMGVSPQSNTGESSRIFRSVLKLPVWGAHILSTMRKEVEAGYFSYLADWLKRRLAN